MLFRQLLLHVVLVICVSAGASSLVYAASHIVCMYYRALCLTHVHPPPGTSHLLSQMFDLDNTLSGKTADLFGFLLFGKKNFNRRCSNREMYKGTLRHMLLSLGNRPSDSGSSLRFCAFDPNDLADRCGVGCSHD